MVQYRDTVIEGKTIELNSTDVHFLGPNLSFINCHFFIKAKSKNFIIRDVKITGGSFERIAGFTDMQFDRVQFENVKFKGRFSGIDFGWWDSSESGSIKNCDFSEATLDACRFLRTDMSTIKLPNWPIFHIPDPLRLAAWVREHKHKWPPKLAIALDVATDIEPGCSASVDNAQMLADADGIALSEMHQLLIQIPGVVIVH
jgi:hypothetical protein